MRRLLNKDKGIVAYVEMKRLEAVKEVIVEVHGANPLLTDMLGGVQTSVVTDVKEPSTGEVVVGIECTDNNDEVTIQKPQADSSTSDVKTVLSKLMNTFTSVVQAQQLDIRRLKQKISKAKITDQVYDL